MNGIIEEEEMEEEGSDIEEEEVEQEWKKKIRSTAQIPMKNNWRRIVE